MNKNYTEIAFILDRSGSMEVCATAAIEGFNAFLKEQQKLEGIAKLTLVLFDNEYLVPVSSGPVQEVMPLDQSSYEPRNTTALLDAMGKTIDELGERLAQMPEAARPGQVIVTVLTDGLENASEKYTWKEVSSRIKRQTEDYKWNFFFLGANQDAIATAAQLSIAAANAATYGGDAAGTVASHRSHSRKASAMRKMAMGLASSEEIRVASAPLSVLVREDDAKERRKKS
jgi:hypothetical protein